MTDLSLFFDVLNPVALSYAVASGLAFGATVPLYISLRFPPKNPISTRVLSFTIGAAAVAAGSLFFAGQLVQAVATDPLWPRAAGRAALWEVFAVCIGLGFGFARSFAHKR